MKKKKWKIVLGIILIIGGVVALPKNLFSGILWAVVGGLLVWSYLKQSKPPLPPVPVAEHQQAIHGAPKKLDQRPAIQADLKIYPVTISEQKRSRRTKFPEINYSNVTKSTKLNDFVVIDTETTGVSPYNDRIVELAAVRFIDGEPVEAFQTLIDPERKIPAQASKVNHITDNMVQESPIIGTVLECFEEFVGNSPVVGHNLPFDLKCLYYSGSCLTDYEKRKYYDTLALSRRFLSTPKRHFSDGNYEYDYDSDYDIENRKLQTILEYYGINPGSAHRALDDAIATGYVLLEFHKQRF